MKQRYRYGFTFLLLLVFAITLISFYTPTVKGFSQSDILWETGAEAGTIPAPFDEAKYGGRSYIEIESSTPVHGATKSYKFFQPDSPVIREEEQVRLFKFSHSSYPKEFYQSCWIYFPSTGSGSNWDISDTTVTALFGWQIRMGKDGNSPTSEWTGGRFRVDKTDKREIEFSYVWDGFIVDRWSDEQKSGLYVEDYLDQWIQLQLYVKVTTGTDSVVRAWVYNPNFNGGVKKQIYDRSDGDWTGTFDCASPEGYSWWDTYDYRYSSRSIDGIPNLRCQLYTSRDDCVAKMAWFDDVVWATAEVPTSYTVGGYAPEFEDFEDGFETGDLSRWNGTTSGGGGMTPEVTSTHKYKGTYAANLTTDGTLYGYAALIRTVQNTSEVYQRSYVRFEDLPDVGSAINVFRTWNTGGTYISNAGIFRNATGTYWKVKVKDDTPETTYLLDNTIAADTWYYMEFYTNVTSNGNATLWAVAEAPAKITKTGDYSALGTLAQVNPCHVTGIGAGSETSVYHDNFRCDNVRIKGGTPKIFQVFNTYLADVEEEEWNEPLQNVKINQTRLTDENGYYEWTNLDYDTEYEFHVVPPSGYYPAWLTNFEGSFSWNGSAYVLLHTITETATGYIEIMFFEASNPYITSSTADLTSVEFNAGATLLDITGDDTGAHTIGVYSSARPTYFKGDAYVQGDYASNIFTISYTFASSHDFTLSYENFDGNKIYSCDAEISGTPSYSSNVLSFSVDKAAGVSTTEVYCAEGRPTWVTNVPYSLAADYVAGTGIFTVTKTHDETTESFDFSWDTLPWTMYFNQVANGYLVTGGTTSTMLRLTGTCVSTDTSTTLYIYTIKRPRYVRVGGSYISFSYNTGTKILSFNVPSSPPKDLSVIFGFSDEETTGFSIFAMFDGFILFLRRKIKKIKHKMEEKLGYNTVAFLLSCAIAGLILLAFHIIWVVLEVYVW